MLRCNVHIPAGMGSGLAGGDKTTISDKITAAATSSKVNQLETAVKFVPTVTLWEFTDTRAKSYVSGDLATDEDDPGRGLDLSDL
ncbi:MAG: hypothetical protein ACXAC5_01945 [Promethearchaeota archaeon]